MAYLNLLVKDRPKIVLIDSTTPISWNKKNLQQRSCIKR